MACDSDHVDLDRWELEGSVPVTVEVDLPRDVFEHARGRAVRHQDDDATCAADVERILHDYLDLEFTWTVEGEPLDDALQEGVADGDG